MPIVARASPGSISVEATRSTSRAIAAIRATVASSSSRAVRSRAAMRRYSRVFQRFSSSGSAASRGSRTSRFASTSTATGSTSRSIVSDRLAPHTAMTVSRNAWSSSTRAPKSALTSSMRSRASHTATGSADRSTASSRTGRTRRRAPGSVWRSTIGASVAPRYAGAMARIRVAMAQLNTVVGDLDGNVARVLEALEEAEQADADVLACPELAVTGYPPEDLVLKPGFVADNRAALEKIAARTGSCVAVVGFVDAGRDLHNAAAICARRRDPRHLSQATPAELRGLRRATHVRAR